MNVRFATRGDLTALLAIERDCFGHDAMPVYSFVQYLELFPSTTLVAEGAEGGPPAGFVIAGASEDPDTAWILDVAVSPAMQGRGVARRLLETVLETLRARGAGRVRATVAPSNSASLALFRGAGFSVESAVNDYFGPGQPRLVLMAEIASVGTS